MSQAFNAPEQTGSWSVVQAPAGAVGFDADAPLDAAAAQTFANNGFSFVVRYVSRATPGAHGDLTAGEVSTILAAGLAIMAIQHVENSPWTPSLPLGTQYGDAAAANAASAGLPVGVTIWLDLEGIAVGVATGDVIAYCNAWFAAVGQAGYRPGLYVGANAVLNANQLYEDLTTQSYWKSGSNVPDVAVRGYCMAQTIDPAYSLAGLGYDIDTINLDAMNATPFWLTAQSAAMA